MTSKSRIDTSREGGGFIALPHVVMCSRAYLKLSHTARSLLLEFALQYKHDNNGRLLCSGKHLLKRGWNSNDTILRAKRELLNAGFIHETVKGQRPNKASWYAITWYTLDKHPAMDQAAVKTFVRSAYRKNDALIPSEGVKKAHTAPPNGVRTSPVAPPDGAMKVKYRYSSAPAAGDHLEVTI